ncbi:DinB family protein [Rossellomorea sp. NRS-1567]|uniref:DinB family protein n=1 Tax=Rossellomorea sp. NRS-1567 TaxID=3233901 RepID=UPI003D2A5E87
MTDLTLIETYKSFLQAYSPEQLRYIPEQGVWSIRQMYDHLLVVAHEYLDSVEACELASGEQTQGKTEFGEYLFNIGGFPPIKIQLPPELNAAPDNTKTKEDIRRELDQLMERMTGLKMKVDDKCSYYKTALEAGTEDVHKDNKIEIINP